MIMLAACSCHDVCLKKHPVTLSGMHGLCPGMSKTPAIQFESVITSSLEANA
jgi:hypothetical protein